MNGDQVVGASFAAPPPAAPPPAPVAPAPPPRVAAVTVKQARIAPSTLHRARRADRRRHRRARRATRARVSFTLSRPATVTATVSVARSGVRKGSRCVVPPRRRARNAKPCTRYVRVTGSRTLRLASGRRSFTLTPVFAKRTLKLGRHRLSLTARDADANRVGPANVAFRIVR
jgi:hypothetical protein